MAPHVHPCNRVMSERSVPVDFVDAVKRVASRDGFRRDSGLEGGGSGQARYGESVEIVFTRNRDSATGLRLLGTSGCERVLDDNGTR